MTVFSRGTPKLAVDLGKLKNERESLCSFLSSKLESEVVLRNNKISVPHDSLSAEDLKHLVNKFVYKKHLNHKFWVALENNVVKIYTFKRSSKRNEQKQGTVPSTIKHGW